MASIAKDGGGKRRIQFVLGKKRPAIRLGKVGQRVAETVARHVEQLVVSKRTGQAVDGDTALWLAGIDDALHAKLAAVELVTARVDAMHAKLGPFLDAYILTRTDLKTGTVANLKFARADLVAYFGEDRPIASIAPADATEFRRHLEKSKAINTVRRICGRAKQFFSYAVDKRILPASSFDHLGDCNVRKNAARQFFVSLDVTRQLLEACPSTEWRLVVGLARYGGLRIPSELVGLTWADVDWANGRLMVRSPKTEHCEGKAWRFVPLFPELRPILETAWDQAPEGAIYVVDRRLHGKTNLRTELERIIKRAGLTSWPKLFQNMRASRETELLERFPIQDVAAWLGNTPAVAMEHYAMTREEHFQRATTTATLSPIMPVAAASMTNCGGTDLATVHPDLEAGSVANSAAQNAAQSAHAGPCQASPASTPETQKAPIWPVLATTGESGQFAVATRQGFEP